MTPTKSALLFAPLLGLFTTGCGLITVTGGDDRGVTTDPPERHYVAVGEPVGLSLGYENACYSGPYVPNCESAPRTASAATSSDPTVLEVIGPDPETDAFTYRGLKPGTTELQIRTTRDETFSVKVTVAEIDRIELSFAPSHSSESLSKDQHGLYHTTLEVFGFAYDKDGNKLAHTPHNALFEVRDGQDNLLVLAEDHATEGTSALQLKYQESAVLLDPNATYDRTPAYEFSTSFSVARANAPAPGQELEPFDREVVTVTTSQTREPLTLELLDSRAITTIRTEARAPDAGLTSRPTSFARIQTLTLFADDMRLLGALPIDDKSGQGSSELTSTSTLPTRSWEERGEKTLILELASTGFCTGFVSHTRLHNLAVFVPKVQWEESDCKVTGTSDVAEVPSFTLER